MNKAVRRNPPMSARILEAWLQRHAETTVCGMLTGAGLAQHWHHSRAHRFFSDRSWSVEKVGRLRTIVPV
jgi:hypothetical protein